MPSYQIGTDSLRPEEDRFPEALARAYVAKLRPLCLCRTPPVEMYIAKVAGKFVMKRMPNSGGDHTPACDSYEPPPELSGLGQVVGSAIQENPDEGLTALKFDFSLSKVVGRAAPTPAGGETDSVKTDGNKLTLRGTLHYLWEEAGFNRWAPSMSGKRSWYVIRKYLLQSAEDKTAKGSSLSDLLYIPESFNAERKDEITQRRMALMARVATPVKGGRRLMLVIGEIKEIAQSRYGHKIIFKHLPESHFMINEDLHKRLLKRFDVELGLWDALEDTHLMAIGTFGVSSQGIASLEEVALMAVTENWIPYESTFDKMVIDSMTRAHRRFMKGMRYNLPSSKPLACIVASDTLPEPTAMYVLAPGASEEYEDALMNLVQESKLSSWIWRAGESEMPALPALQDVS